MSAVRTSDVWVRGTGLRYPTPRSVQFASAEDFLRLALQAHLAACRDMVPPPGERWIDADLDSTWAGPEDFMQGLLHHLGDRLRRHAIKTRHLAEVPWTADEVAEHEAFEAETQSWLDDLDARASGAGNGAAAGAGRSPAHKGQGCPALLSAVGPALEVSPGRDITLNGDPLCCACEVQELPGDLPRPHTHPDAEETLR